MHLKKYLFGCAIGATVAIACSAGAAMANTLALVTINQQALFRPSSAATVLKTNSRSSSKPPIQVA